MPDLQTTLATLNNRLLKAEGRVFGLTELIRTLIVMEAIPSDKFKEHVSAVRAAYNEEMRNGLDHPTETFVTAARDLMDGILKTETGPLGKPVFSVIEGGKTED
jgi:hypothetical protein